MVTTANEIDRPSKDINAPPNVADVLLITAATAAIAPIVATAILRLITAALRSLPLSVANSVIDNANIPTAAASSSMASALVLSASALSKLLN